MTAIIKASALLANKLSKNSVEQSISRVSKDLVLLNHTGWKFLTYKKIKKDVSNIFFKLIDLKFFYILNKNKEKWYKSNLIEELNVSELEFRTFKNKKDKLKVDNSTLINIKSEEVKDNYDIDLKIIMLFQWSDWKLYSITSSKTNYKLLFKFFENNNNNYDIVFKLSSTIYTDNWNDFSVLDYSLNEKEKIEKKDLTKEIEEFIKIYNL